MDKKLLKEKVIAAIDSQKDKIIDLAQNIWEHPELGYKEFFGTKATAEFFQQLSMDCEQNIARTGCQAELLGQTTDGPTVAVLGELDAIICQDHKDADSETGAVHACGHHMQIAAMAGVALGLKASGIMEHLSGKVRFMAVPAEEFVELSFRSELREKGEIKYYGGKQELIAKGLFKDVDMAMMIHGLNLPKDKKVLIGPNGNGFIGKEVKFIGRESHAGSAPEKGVNALNAAMIAMTAIHAQRETFKDEDRIRVHPMLTKGGDVTNVVPADVRMESYTRARTVDAMVDANAKVDRALKAGAMAVGAEVEIKDTPGYLPLLNHAQLDSLFRENAKDLIGESAIVEGGDFTGSFDFGDVSHLMPALHPFVGGLVGDLHTRDFEVVDIETALIMPAKLLATTIVDLLADQAIEAKKITDSFEPVLTTEKYLSLLENLDKTTKA